MNLSKFMPSQVRFTANPRLNLNVHAEIKEPANFEKKDISIEEILNKVKSGDLNVLNELGIAYSVTEDNNGNKRIEFEYQDVKYSVPVIAQDNVEVPNSDSNIVKNEDGSYTIFEYDPEGNLLGAAYYDADGELTETRRYHENGYSAQYYRNGVKTTDVEIDKQGRPGHQVDYNADGSIARIWEPEYNEDGSYTTICKDANGKLISVDITDTQGRGIRSERYENGELKNIIETNYYEDGSSRQIHKNPDGKITWIIYWSADGPAVKNVPQEDKKFLSELLKLLEEYSNSIVEIQRQILGFVAPNPPIAADFQKSDGSVDDEAYNKAYTEYQKEVAAYNKEIKELNQKLLELQTNKIQLNNQINDIINNEKIAKLNEEISKLEESPNANKELIEALKEQLSQIPFHSGEEMSELSAKLLEINMQINGLVIPTPPYISDFTRYDGTIDEEAYAEAMNEYEYAKYEYDRKIAELQAKANVIMREIAIKEFESKRASEQLDKVEKNIKTVQDIQNRLDNLENTPENQDLIANLKALLVRATENIQSQVEIQKKLDQLFNQMQNLQVPVPPSTLDYLKEDGTVDEEAYTKAFEDYKKACAEFEKEQERLNAQMDIFSNELKKLEFQLNLLNRNNRLNRQPYIINRKIELTQFELQHFNGLYRK